MKTWNPTKNTIDEIFELPKGRLIANFGFKCEVSFYSQEVETVANALKLANIDSNIHSQAHALIVAQQNELECTVNYAPLSGG